MEAAETEPQKTTRAQATAGTGRSSELLTADIVNEKPSPDNPVVFGAIIQPGKVKRGQTITLYVQVRIAPGWHIYENSSTGAIPTRLKLVPKRGGEPIGTWVYPPGKPTDDRSSVHYEGTVTFRHKLRVAAEATPGPLEVGCEIAYQACDPFECRAPTNKKLKATVIIGVE